MRLVSQYISTTGTMLNAFTIVFFTYFVLCSAWKSYEFAQIKVSNYKIEETKSGFKSVVQCTDYCLNNRFCQGLSFEAQICKLFTDITESNDGSGLSILKLKYPRNKISQLEFKTNAGVHQGTDDPIGIEICDEIDFCCQIYPADKAGPDFEAGQIDIFTGSDLKDCQDFYVHGLKSVKMWIEGGDGWLGDYLKIKLNVQESYYCPITQLLDDDGSIYLNCKLVEI